MALTEEQLKALALARARQRQSQTAQPPGQSRLIDPSASALEQQQAAFSALGPVQRPLTPEEAETGRAAMLGIPGVLPAAISGAVAEPVAGLAGLAAAPFSGAEGAAKAVEKTREFLTLPTIGKNAETTARVLGKAFSSVGETMKGPGEAVFKLTGSPALAAATDTLIMGIPEVAAGRTGLKAGSKIKVPPTPMKQKVAVLLAKGSPDNVTAKYLLDGAGKVVKDKNAIQAIKQGFDEGMIAAIKGSSKADRSAMRQMVNILERGKKSARFGAANRPSDIVGKSLVDRFNRIKELNKQSVSELDKAASALKGSKFESFGPINAFIDDLNEIGVSLVETNGKVRPRFSGSDIEGLTGPENLIKRVVNRMAQDRPVDAFEAHKLKRFIDEQVTFGKLSEGLTGNSERIVKKLRAGIDDVLDSSSPAYNAANTKYADTINVLKGFEAGIGKKFDINSPNVDKFVGTQARRILGNTQSRVEIMDSLADMQQVAVKYGKGFDDDIVTQAMFADELSKRFGAPAKTSLQGELQKAAEFATQSNIQRTTGAARKFADKISGVSDEKAIEAMKKLLAQ